MAIKDHVSKRGPRIRDRFNKSFSFTLQDLEAALFGDPDQMKSACKKISTMGRESQLMLKILPQIKEHLLTNLEATTQYNSLKAELFNKAASSYATIDKAASSVALGERRYKHLRSETARDYFYAVSQENRRHALQEEYSRLKYLVDQSLVNTDSEARLLGQVNRPALKQLDEDYNNRIQRIKHVLTYGNENQEELIPKKDYQSSFSQNIGAKMSDLASRFGILL